MNPQIEKLIHSISLELNMNKDVVREVISSQFRQVQETIASGDKDNPDTFKNIQVTHLGKFYVTAERKKYFKKKAKARLNDDGV